MASNNDGEVELYDGREIIRQDTTARVSTYQREKSTNLNLTSNPCKHVHIFDQLYVFLYFMLWFQCFDLQVGLRVVEMVASTCQCFDYLVPVITKKVTNKLYVY